MPRIICIDPDAGRVEEPVAVLRSAGYEVMLAFSAEVGMALVRLFPPDIVLLHSGLAERMAQPIHQACPSVPIVLTGDKPVSPEELLWVTAHQRAGVRAQEARHLPH